MWTHQSRESGRTVGSAFQIHQVVWDGAENLARSCMLNQTGNAEREHRRQDSEIMT